MSKQIPFKKVFDQAEESGRYYCNYCGFPCKEGRDAEGSYGESGWDFTDGQNTGSNLITNGEFTAVTTGWTASNCTLASVAGGQSGNGLTLTRSSGDSQYAYQAFSDLTFGQIYRFQAYVKSGTSGNEAFALRLLSHDRDVTKYEKTGTSSSTWTQYTLDWRVFHGDNNIALIKNSSTAGTMLFDTATVYAYDYFSKEAQSACPGCGSKNWK
uniref:CBM-cenC domain-containing protein n=1 Tax=viral metagenome TaxID=1070528 RepID=A0A6M3LHV3_9ZZZZ